jgi:hypothetical protein
VGGIATPKAFYIQKILFTTLQKLSRKLMDFFFIIIIAAIHVSPVLFKENKIFIIYIFFFHIFCIHYIVKKLKRIKILISKE